MGLALVVSASFTFLSLVDPMSLRVVQELRGAIRCSGGELGWLKVGSFIVR